MLRLEARFYPAHEKKNGYVGKADITIANAFRINNISVFENEDGTRNIRFAEYGSQKKRKFFAWKNEEAHAALLGVVEKAMGSENGWAYENGTYGPDLNVTGAMINGKYADGAFSVEIGDVGTLNGITTRKVEYEQDGELRSFISVDVPIQRDSEGKAKKYTDKDGNEKYDYEFEGLISKYTDKEGKEVEFNWADKLTYAVRDKRDELIAEKKTERKQGIGEQMSDAAQKRRSQRTNESKEKDKAEELVR